MSFTWLLLQVTKANDHIVSYVAVANKSFFFQSCLFYALKIQQSHALLISSICYDLLTADVDECAIGNHSCHESATCHNNQGSYTCSCNSGYAGDGIFCTSKCIYLLIRVYSKHVIQLCGFCVFFCLPTFNSIL